MNELWQRLQDKEWDLYKKEGSVGTFSVDGLRGAEMTGAFINKLIPKECCLDVGCGALAYPSYMKAAPDVYFIGIDPYEGDVEKDFYFLQGYAESLSFPDNDFDGVLFATSLDHVIDPVLAIKEAKRVLKDEGYLFVWTAVRDNDKLYRAWLSKPKPAQYDKYHMWAFTRESLLELIGDLELIEEIIVWEAVGAFNERILIFKNHE